MEDCQSYKIKFELLDESKLIEFMGEHGYNASHGRLTRSDFDEMGLKMSNYDFRTFKTKFQRVQRDKLKRQLEENPDAFQGSDSESDTMLPSNDSQVLI